MTSTILISLLVGTLCLIIGLWLGYNIRKQQLIIESEERAVKIVENWIHKLEAQKYKNHMDNTYNIQIIEWTIEQCIENEDYEEAARLQKILDELREEGDST
tara:strand:- start:912 stop:1217 length:306 start_codon:yes stop_codon:yes gene_type:complete